MCTDPSLSYSWSDASGPVGSTAVVSVSPLTPTTYTLTVTDPVAGVSGTDAITEKTTAQQSPEFNLSEEAKGVYMVVVRSENKVYTGKIILK